MSTASLPRRPLLPALAGIRFFAAIHVCLHHLAQMAYALTFYHPTKDELPLRDWAAGTWAIFSDNWMVNSLMRGALVQVGMFFVMSGFILTYSHPMGPGGKFDYRGYTLARTARVYAMYLIGLLVTLPIAFALTATNGQARDEIVITENSPEMQMMTTAKGIETRNRAPEPIYTPAEKVTAFIVTPLLLQAWFPRLSIYPWNPPAWSLSVEAFAYVIFPLFAIWMLRWSTKKLIIFAVLCWVFELIAPIWYIMAEPDGVNFEWNMNAFWFNFVRHNPILRVPEFLIGMVAGRLFAEKAAANAVAGKGTGGWLSTIAVTFIIGFMMMSDTLFGQFASYMLLHNGLLAPVFAIGVIGLALGGGPVAAICSRRPIVVAGEAAYAIYMLHFAFLAYSLVVFIGGAKEGKAPPDPWTYLWVFLIGVTLLSIAVHKWWEVPWRRRIRRIMLFFWPDRSAPITVEASK